MPESAQPFDPIVLGRIGIDPYPLQTGVPLARVVEKRVSRPFVFVRG